MKKIYSILTVFITLVVMSSCSKDDPIPSSLNDIESFEIAFEGVEAKDVQINKTGENINISVPFKTNLTGLKPNIKISDKATVLPASGETVDFEDGVAKQFTVTAEDKTTKIFNVTITTRGEVGSGSKLNTYLFVKNYAGIFDLDNTLTTYTYDETSKFVSEYSVLNNANSKTLVYKFVYDSKNQITEKKCESEKTSSVYTYNDKGQIISSTDKEDGTLVYSYAYSYDDEGNLTKTVRKDEENSTETTYTFKYTNGNVTEETVGNETYSATFDDKNNPFMALYPSSYAKIESGIHRVNKNNPKTLNIIDGEVANTYNADSYPLTVSYTAKEIPVTTNKTFTYND